MTHPIPPGTRDVLPDEMRELRAIGDRMRAAFEGAGYGEVHTPALEYEDVLRLGEERAAGARYRTFDEQGAVLALRSDMTIPIARVVGTRYADAEPPLRFCYFAHAWRAVERGVGEPREFLQGGLELLGCLSRRDLVGLERVVSDLPARALLVELPTLRGGPEVLDRAEGLRALHAALERRGVADRVIYDLGLVRELGYYTGAVFEVYDPAVGFTLGGGGRYDELLGRFGRDLPACGVALDVQRVHQAQAAEEALG